MIHQACIFVTFLFVSFVYTLQTTIDARLPARRAIVILVTCVLFLEIVNITKLISLSTITETLQWHHECGETWSSFDTRLFFEGLIVLTMKTSWKFCVNGNLQRNPPVTARFHTQMVSNANASMSWRQHVSRGLNHSVSFYSQCPHQPSTILVSNFFTYERIVLLTINTLKLKLLLLLHKCRNICQLVVEAAHQQILVHFLRDRRDECVLYSGIMEALYSI